MGISNIWQVHEGCILGQQGLHKPFKSNSVLLYRANQAYQYCLQELMPTSSILVPESLDQENTNVSLGLST